MPFPSLLRAGALAAGLTLIFSLSVRGVEIDENENSPDAPHVLKDMGTRKAEPEVAPASPEGEQALERMKLPAGLKASLWAAEPMLANPVAFNIDEHGRVFVAETYRYRTSVLDIRDYMWMLEDDLASRSIEDRSALILKKFGPAGVAELSKETELVRLIEDRDHDGKADFSTIYADGFNSPLDGIAAGVLARRGEVWFTNIPSLWHFTGKEKAETRTELSRGYGIRFNYTGHDFHGLIFGPDGKLYFSVGDRAAHVKTKEGGVIDAQDTGSVFRCNPDGTELELFATGLRNPQSLLFTENGDLFTGDNDSDQGDQERLVHIVEDGDSGWRIGYQFAPRGNAGPWNSEKMWHPRHAAQPAFIIPPICDIEDGPSGIAYYPGTGLNASWKGTIFITHFKGSITRSGIYAYNVKPNGATYSIADAKPFLTNALPTDVRFGPDGRMYYSDWAEGWPKSKRGRIYAIFDPKHVDDPLIKDTQKLIGDDTTKESADALAQQLGHADWRVRLEAQFTLAERGAEGFAAFDKILNQTDAPAYARLHATWGLGQLAAHGNADALARLHPLLTDKDSEVRAQAAKLLGDRHAADALAALTEALHDSDARVRFFAAQSLGKLGHPESAKPLLALLRENDDKDNYVRHAAVMGLVGTKNFEALAAGAQSTSRAERLGVLLAWRRLNRPEIAAFLHDPDPFLVREAALAINDAPVAHAWPDLAAMIANPVNDEPVMLRVVNANFRLGQPANAQALAEYAARSDAPESLRTEALAQLALWPKPPARDRIVGIFRPFPEKTRDAEVARRALAAALPKILHPGSPDSVEAAALATLETLEVPSAAETLVAVVNDAQQSPATRAAALKALDKLKYPQMAGLVAVAGESDAPELRLAALPIAAKLSPDTVAPLLARLATEGKTEEQKAAYKALATLQHPSVDPLMADQLRKLAAGQVPIGAQLELLDAAAQRTNPTVKQLLAQREDSLAASSDPLASFRVALEGGDARAGGRIFYGQPVMACIRCHSSGNGGGDAGPNLAGIGKREPREYLLESVVKPNAKIAPGFDSIVVTLKSGAVVGGIVAGETADALKLRNADSKVVEVKKAEIAKREGAPSSMPEIYGAILTKKELRDVVAYLASLTRPADDAGMSEEPRALHHWND